MYSSHDIDTESVDCAEAANPMKRKKNVKLNFRNDQNEKKYEKCMINI